MSAKTCLIVQDEAEIHPEIIDAAKRYGFRLVSATTYLAALAEIQSKNISIVFSDIHLCGKSGFKFLEEFKRKSTQQNFPPWIFISTDHSPEVMEMAFQSGASDVILKPFNRSAIENVFRKNIERANNPLQEIMDMVQSISGIQLGKEKQMLVETRLTKRILSLKLASTQEYLNYFRENRKTEVSQLVSLITTHTTEFFRESEHFDYVYERILPKIIGKKHTLRVWSAASSTGQEAYSLAIMILEYCREKAIPREKWPKIEIIGTDIDTTSVEKANEGIYESRSVSTLHPEIVKRYFDQGSGDFSGFVKVKDSVHKLCRFYKGNLHAKEYALKEVDIAFLRNVLIYFKPEDIAHIATKIERTLSDDGVLFLGHSESFGGMNAPLKLIGNSIYVPLRSPESNENSPSPSQSSSTAIKVFIIDDSLTVRKMLRSILSPDQGFDVLGEAENPIDAEKKLKHLSPDVITLDIHMPEMDGVTYLEKLSHRPHPPIVMISSINYEEATKALRCFELGAVDYIEKPNGLNLESEAERIRVVIQNAFACGGKKATKVNTPQRETFYLQGGTGLELITIGASTGGVEALKEVLTQFPSNTPPILIVQHIPPVFSQAFAKRMNEVCKIKVTEAIHGEKIEPSHAYIAPGGKQMRLKLRAGVYLIEITDDAPVNRHKPSVDYLFDSLVPLTDKLNISAAILTGMGADGAKGLKHLRDAGVHTIAQNEETCVVYGMPKAAVALDAAKEVLPLTSIPYHLFRVFNLKRAA